WLALRVAEANVVFEYFGALMRKHEARIEHSTERAPRTFQRMHGGNEHVLFDPVQHVGLNERRWAVGAHATRVGATVAVVGWLVILRRGQRDNGLAVGNRQHAGLLPIQSLFNNDLVAGLAEDPLPRDLVDGGQGIAAV